MRRLCWWLFPPDATGIIEAPLGSPDLAYSEQANDHHPSSFPISEV